MKDLQFLQKENLKEKNTKRLNLKEQKLLLKIAGSISDKWSLR